MADDDGHDRRRAERIPINTEFAAMPSATYISDLSEYGVFVHTEEPAPMGTKLKLRFTVVLDDPVVIAAEGRVVRHQHDPQGMGIEFTELDPETILRINDVVSRQRPRDSGPPLAQGDEPAEAAEADEAPAPADEAPAPADEEAPADDEDLDAAQTLSRGKKATPDGSSTKLFRPPPMPDFDESQKTALFQAVEEAPAEDSE